jgi:hypothetical protein
MHDADILPAGRFWRNEEKHFVPHRWLLLGFLVDLVRGIG